MADHYQCRIAKRLDGRQVITFPTVGRLYPHEQKTLKGYHSLQDVIERAKEFNSSSLEQAVEAGKEFSRNLPIELNEVIGLVIVHFKAGRKYQIVNTPSGKKGTRIMARVPGKTEWLRFINRKCEVYELDPKSHVIIHKLGNV